MRHKKNKKSKNKLPFLLCAVSVLVVILVALVIFFLFPKEAPSVYVWPENVKQGDTVFIRVKTDASKITGNLGSDRLVFYKKAGSNEWISFLGIDADLAPGNYTVFADTSKAEHLKKDIKVALADFSSAPAATAPSAAKTGITAEKAIDNLVKNDGPALKKVLSKFTQKPYFTDSFSFPLSKIQKSGFSFGKFINFAKYKLQHFGVDLMASEKTDIHAINDGKVVATLDLPNYGKTVIIDHGLDIFSLYLHLSEFKVAEGDMVKRGQRIGLSGDTGYVTAPHLHFSMRVGTSRVDPLVFIEATKKLNENFFLADLTAALRNVFPF